MAIVQLWYFDHWDKVVSKNTKINIKARFANIEAEKARQEKAIRDRLEKGQKIKSGNGLKDVKKWAENLVEDIKKEHTNSSRVWNIGEYDEFKTYVQTQPRSVPCIRMLIDGLVA